MAPTKRADDARHEGLSTAVEEFAGHLRTSGVRRMFLREQGRRLSIDRIDSVQRFQIWGIVFPPLSVPRVHVPRVAKYRSGMATRHGNERLKCGYGCLYCSLTEAVARLKHGSNPEALEGLLTMSASGPGHRDVAFATGRIDRCTESRHTFSRFLGSDGPFGICCSVEVSSA
jgi:hypothetical protein